MVRKLTKKLFFCFYPERKASLSYGAGFLLFIFYPLLSFAQGAPEEPPEDFKGFVQILIDLIDLAVPVVIGMIFVMFLWGLSIFILQADNEEKREVGKRLMFWGTIGLFTALSVWALVSILTGSFGFEFIIPR